MELLKDNQIVKSTDFTYNGETLKTLSINDIKFDTYTIRAYFELDGTTGWNSSTEPGAELTNQNFSNNEQTFTLNTKKTQHTEDKGTITVNVDTSELTSVPLGSKVVVKVIDSNNSLYGVKGIDYSTSQNTYNFTFSDLSYGTYTVKAFIDTDDDFTWVESIDYKMVQNDVALDSSIVSVDLVFSETSTSGKANINVNFSGFDSSYNNKKVYVEISKTAGTAVVQSQTYDGSFSLTFTFENLPFDMYDIKVYFDENTVNGQYDNGE